MRLILTVLLFATAVCGQQAAQAQVTFHRGYYDPADARSYGIHGALIETSRGDFVFNVQNGLVCTDSMGATKWMKDFSTTGSVPAQYLQTSQLLALPGGNFLVFGRLPGGTGSFHDTLLVTRLTPSGLVVWCKILTFPTISSNAVLHRKAILTSDGNILMCLSHAMGNAGYALATLIDQSGTIQWQRTYRVTSGAPYNDFFINDVSECANGDFIICGNGYLSTDINIVARINNSGALLWARKLDNYVSTAETRRPSNLRELTNGDIRVIIQNPMLNWGKAFITLDSAGYVKGTGRAFRIPEGPEALIFASGDMAFAGLSDSVGLVKVDNYGNVVAAFDYEVGVHPTMVCISATHDNGFALGGICPALSPFAYGYGYLVKTGPGGQAPPFTTSVSVDTAGYTATSVPMTMKDSMVSFPLGYVALTSVANVMKDTLFAQTVDVPFVGTSLEPCVYPNPARSIVSFTSGKTYDVKVRTITGRTVVSLSHVRSIDVSGLAAGVYMLQLSDPQGKVYGLQRLVKE
jgi:hypothetical protein